MDSAPLSFIDRELPPWLEHRLVVLGAGDERPYDEAEWHGALVVVERGELELGCTRGGYRRFPAGSVLWLAGLPLRIVRNPGAEPLLLSAVARQTEPTDEFPAAASSLLANPNDEERRHER